jgi:hypothetical protein
MRLAVSSAYERRAESALIAVALPRVWMELPAVAPAAVAPAEWRRAALAMELEQASLPPAPARVVAMSGELAALPGQTAGPMDRIHSWGAMA